jgi:DNA-binding NarL/FixJ family response regulator
MVGRRRSSGPPLVLYEQAARAHDPVPRVQASALRAVTALVPTVLSAFISVTRRLTTDAAVVLQAEGGGVALEREWERYLRTVEALDPFAPHRPAATEAVVLALEDVAAPEFRSYLLSIGMRDQLTVYLRSAGTVVARVALLRASDAAPFTAADAVALRRIQPLLEQAYNAAAEPRPEPDHAALLSSGLTEREADVAALVARGATNAQIAHSLNVSEATVKTHLVHIYSKLGIRSRTRLAILVGRHETFG